MSSPSLFILKHLPSKTYYGTRRSFRKRGPHDALPVATKNVEIRPHYNIIGFERFQDAIIVADSIATYQTIHRKNPIDQAICLYPETQILVDAIENELWVTETNLNDLRKKMKNRNIGVKIVHEIKISDLGDLVVRFSELELDEQHTNYDFIDSLENNLNLQYDEDQ